MSNGSATERHYTISEIACLWAFSEKTVRRIFENEAGVLSLGTFGKVGKKRGYISLRVPESIMIRVHQRLRLT